MKFPMPESIGIPASLIASGLEELLSLYGKLFLKNIHKWGLKSNVRRYKTAGILFNEAGNV